MAEREAAPPGAAPSVGEPAPAFTLPAGPGEEVDVGERIGERPFVLLFFPLAFSSVCTAEMCRFRDDWSGWREADVEVFAISVDSLFVAREFREANDLPFPVLSDFNREVSRRYGVLAEEMWGLRGIARRAVFLVDARGRIAWSWIADDSGDEPDYGAIRRAAEAL